jgi:ABC-2 type transport system permease protein
VSLRITAATTARVLRQLSHDHRTIALLLVVPLVLLFLINALLDGNQILFDRIGLTMLGIFPRAHHRHPGTAAHHPPGQG